MTSLEYDNKVIADAKRLPVLNKADVTSIYLCDVYRYQHPHNGEINSRYGTLLEIGGEIYADRIMRELEVKSW